MAEFLIYCKRHWMDDLTQEEIDEHIKKYPNFQQKYDMRYQKGDIVEVRPDGYWTDGKRKGFGSHAFALIITPNLIIEEAQKYTEGRYKEVIVERDEPKLDYLEDAKVGLYKYDPTVIEEYIKPTNVPDLGIVDIEWVKLSGIVDEMDRRCKYQMDMTQIPLSMEKKAELSNIEDAHIIDKSKVI